MSVFDVQMCKIIHFFLKGYEILTKCGLPVKELTGNICINVCGYCRHTLKGKKCSEKCSVNVFSITHLFHIAIFKPFVKCV